MKRILALLLIFALALSLGACGGDDEEQQAVTPTPTATVAPSYKPTAPPTATPFPRVNVSDYVLIWRNDAKRGMNYMVPTHWVLEQSGDQYVVYFEPVPEGECGFRLSLARKKKSKEPDASQMRAELRKLLTEMEKSYDDFYSNGEISRDFSLVKFKGYSNYYTFNDEFGVKHKGFVIIATYNKRIYCMNFSGPESRFDEMSLSVGSRILESISRTT